MRKSLAVLLVVVVSVVALGGLVGRAQQAPAPPPEPLVRANATEKIAPHTYWIADNDIGAVPNIGIVVGDRATLVIDSGLGPRNGETAAREAAKVTRGGDQYLAMTHYHPEHDLGAQGFPAATKVIRWKTQDQDLMELGLAVALDFATRTPFNLTLLKGTNFRKTDISFDRDYRLDLGGVHVRMSGEGPAHTRGDTAFFVEEDRVLFTGDIVMAFFPAFQPQSNVRTWNAALERLDALKPSIIIPSHSKRGDASLITAYRAYFAALQPRAAALKKEGKSEDDAARMLQTEMAAQFPAMAYRGVNNITNAARAAYREAP